MRLKNLIALAASVVASAAGAETLVCVPERLSLAADESVGVSAMVDTNTATRFRWSGSKGHFQSRADATTVWHPDGAAPGKYRLRVTASTAQGEQACELSVVIPQTVLSLGDVRRYFLLPNEVEPEGFASYSYILFGSVVSDVRKLPAAREVVRAFLATLRSVADVEAVTHKEAFNLTMLPVKEEPPEGVLQSPASDFAVDWVLQAFDYDRAVGLLDQYSKDILAQTGREYWTGPYILSRRGAQIVVDDMTNARPSLADRWVKLHVTQVTQQEDWSQRTSGSFSLGLMTVMNTWAEGVVKTKEVVSGWLLWFESYAPSQ